MVNINQGLDTAQKVLIIILLLVIIWVIISAWIWWLSVGSAPAPNVAGNDIADIRTWLNDIIKFFFGGSF